jgi:hypothetical protein
MTPSTRARWAAVLVDFERSGLCVREFCDRRGISAHCGDHHPSQARAITAALATVVTRARPRTHSRGSDAMEASTRR